MKKTAIILIVASLISCNDAFDDIKNCKKPAIVFSKHKSVFLIDRDRMTIKDADGNLISLHEIGCNELIDKYNIGDTIK